MGILFAAGVFGALTSGVFAETPRYVVDDEAMTKTATEAAAKLQQNGKLLTLNALLAQPPSREPVRFAAPVTAPLATTELYDRLRASTIAVGAFYQCHKCKEWHANFATGFVVAEGGIVSTSAHVLSYDDEEMKGDAFAVAMDAAGRVFPVEALLANDEESDTCLIRVAAPKLPPLPVRAGARAGERVFCLSHPNGHYFMFTQGIVARVSRSATLFNDGDDEPHAKSRSTLSLEVTSEYSPGSSGGPIADESGNIVAQVDVIDTTGGSDTEDGLGGVVAARTATAAEEILRLADPAKRPASTPVEKTDPTAALAALRKATQALKNNQDDNAAEKLEKTLLNAVKRARPAMKTPAARHEFALLAFDGLAVMDAPPEKLMDKVVAMLEETVADKGATTEQKMKASHFLVADAAEQIGTGEQFADWEKQYRAHTAAFPRDGELSALKKMCLESAEEFAPDRLESLAKELSGDPDNEVSSAAQTALATVAARRVLQAAPLELKFTALDGAAVDVAKLRGKVVLLDFWATWCGPCLEELPNVKAAYDKLHARGFEVIGISLDADKPALEEALKKKGMVWPQYFDGKAFDSALVQRFGISGIPAMMLLNKKGYIVDFDACGQELSAKIEKLLAE